MRHNLEPHEAAIPYSLTGHLLGRSNFAGLGAAVGHRFVPTGHPEPYSYALMPNNIPIGSDNFQGIHATGTHGGEFRPLTVVIGPSGSTITTRLARTMGTDADALLQQYRALYKDELRWSGGPPTRSKAFQAYDTSLNAVLSASTLTALLTPAPFTPGTDPECPAGGTAGITNLPAACVKVAAYLLTQPNGPRHVGLIDGGLITASGGGAYDTHNRNVRDTSVNLWNVLSALADRIDPSPTPAAGKISLSDTLVVLKTEFGRTPMPSGNGRNHWPQGYVNVLIGGPITTRGIAGTMNGAGHGVTHYTSTDLHGALLMAAGIFPFESENFGVGDFGPSTKRATATGEEDTATELRRQVLGLP
jgi:uncharacterized protein (DUF1501 family)